MHLSRGEFVDLIESSTALPAERAHHVEQCERCRQEAATLRAMRSMVSDDETQEPSPLFWDHFSARVAEQLRREPVPTAERPWRPLPLVTWAAAATVVLLLISTFVWRTTLHAPAPHPPIEASGPTALPTVETADDMDNDEAWAVVRAATADLAWEDARDAGISAHPGDVENAALQLNAAERVELERLLDEDMKRNGA